MATFQQSIKDLKLMQWEGGYANDPNDSGGPTNHGVTLAVWQKHGYDKNGDGKIDAEDVKLITQQEAIDIAKKIFWNPLKLDDINSQLLANLVFQISWGSGRGTAAKVIKSVINQYFDKKQVIDKNYDDSIHAYLKKTNQENFYFLLRAWYINFLLNISQPGSKNAGFRKGWINRMNDVLPELKKK